jgi:hypothetical protein
MATLTLDEAAAQAIEDIAYAVDGDPSAEAEQLGILLNTLPRPRLRADGAPVDDDFPLYALRHLLEALIGKRTRARAVQPIARARRALIPANDAPF